MDETSELIGILDLETIELDMFRGRTPGRETGRIFGGQVIAQALAAAYRTIDGRICHSLHAYFIRPGDPKVPILFKVERVRDGGSFSTRRVIAIQHGRQIFNLAASFQVPEAGFEHQTPAPGGPGPDGLLNEEELRARAGKPDRDGGWVWPVEVRPVDPRPEGPATAQDPRYSIWFRARGAVGDDIAINQCVLAYASDMSLMDASLRPHAVDWNCERLQAASLDHALWFHQPSRLSDWHLYVQDSPSASGGRGFNRGGVFDAQGRLVASATQEALIRLRAE